MSNAKDVLEMSPAKDLLSRKEAGPGPHPPKSLDHLALSVILSSCADLNDGLEALQRLRREFVDWNEVRVARVQEIVRVLEPVADAEEIAARIKEEYNAFFEKKGALGFDFLAAGKPAEARRHLHQMLPRIGKGAATFLLYEFCPGASLPLSEDSLRQARRDGIVGKTGDRNQVARALGDGMELSEAVLLLQYWELEATGSPYGEAAKKDMANGAAKKGKKSPPKAKGQPAGKQK